jgi:uncharacterized protein (TIGR00369 family)
MTFILPTLTPGYRADLKALIEAMPSSRWLGLAVAGFAEGVSVIEMPVRPDMTFDGRAVTGGIVGTLADYAAVSAATAAMPDGWLSSTTSFQVYNLEPASGETLIAIGRVIHVAKSSGAGSANVYARRSGTHVLVASATATCRLFKTATG